MQNDMINLLGNINLLHNKKNNVTEVLNILNQSIMTLDVEIHIPDISKYFTDKYFTEKRDKYLTNGRQYHPLYFFKKLKRDVNNSNNQYLHYYLQKKYKNKLNVMYDGIDTKKSSINDIEKLIKMYDPTKINIIPIKSTGYDPHISIVLINPFTKTIEYYNTLCVLGKPSDCIFKKIGELLPDFTMHKSAELVYQRVSGRDMLCELWICFITECRILNSNSTYDVFITNMKKINTFYEYVITERKNIADLIKEKHKHNFPCDILGDYHWYAEIISTYALYFEHEIIDDPNDVLV